LQRPVEIVSMQEGAKLLDAVSHQLFFCSWRSRRPPARQPLPFPSEVRLVAEASTLLDQLAEVPVTSVAHHLLEIHAFTLDVRPTEALAAIARIITGSPGQERLDERDGLECQTNSSTNETKELGPVVPPLATL
jgi:hypothetical protein